MARININDTYGKAFKMEIQRSFNFLVDFNFPQDSGTNVMRIKTGDNKFSNFVLIERKIERHHVKNVTLPEYNFAQENQSVGIFKRSTPIYNQDKSLDLKLEMVEDDRHTIGFMIQYLQSLIIDEFGVYKATYYNNNASAKKIAEDKGNKPTSLEVRVSILSNTGDMIAKYTYYNCYFQSASESTYDYGENGLITRTITLGTDYYSVEYFDKEFET